MLPLVITIVLFALTGLGLYAAFKDKLGKVGSTLSSGLGALSGYVLETTSGYSWILGLAFSGSIPAIIFVVGHIALVGVLVFNTIRYKQAIK